MSNTKSNTEKKILVLGSTGKTGRRVMQRLVKLDQSVLGVTHSSTPKFDWNDSASWEKVLDNIKSVYISFYPDLAIPGAVKAMEAFSKVAVKKGVQQLVLLSGRGEEEAQQCEKIVMKAGVDWTIVRASWFFQNFSEGSFLEPVLSGHIALPAGDVGEPFVDADDIADVAVAALTQEGHNGKVYEVTGPRLLTFKQAVEEIANATGKPIQFEKVPMKDYESVLKEYGLPKDMIWLITYLFTEVLDGRNENLTDGVYQALGRKPTDFSEFAKKTAAAGVWNK
ncbi:NAD(P)H-binding protein [Chryseolinea soli]|uniref:NmrA family transcriptional regulator n=1 Tax=Chryseolinea soli TaxID=2321403 RepID=A0A385T1W1_9BACT|nr:NAD(P)H-binding protein [Chryseolinea soli]AYB35118.1 NmrA family transcriptional regulator [Chryseolinea soli]